MGNAGLEKIEIGIKITDWSNKTLDILMTSIFPVIAYACEHWSPRKAEWRKTWF